MTKEDAEKQHPALRDFLLGQGEFAIAGKNGLTTYIRIEDVYLQQSINAPHLISVVNKYTDEWLGFVIAPPLAAANTAKSDQKRLILGGYFARAV